MKKSMMALAVALSALTAIPAMAALDVDTFRFECPKASGGVPSERLTNYGTYIRGMGEENHGPSKFRPIFAGVSNPHIPKNLSTGGYSHAGAQYNPSTGRITCLYTSSYHKPSFNVSYVGENVKNGIVIRADNSKITIRVAQG